MALDTVAARSRRRRLPSVDVPRVDDDELRRSIEAIKEHLRMYEGDSGAPKERFVTIEELEKAGLIGTKTQGNFALINEVLGSDVAQGQQAGSQTIIIEGSTATGGGGSDTLAGLSDTSVDGAAAGSFLRLEGGAWRGVNIGGVDPNFTVLQTFNACLRVAGIDSGYVDFCHDNTDLIITGNSTTDINLVNLNLNFQGLGSSIQWTDIEFINFEYIATSYGPGVGYMTINWENGVDGQRTPYVDDQGRTWIFGADASNENNDLSSAVVKFGSLSYYCAHQGTGDDPHIYCDVSAEDADFKPGTRDWYVGFWFNNSGTYVGGNDFLAIGDIDSNANRCIRFQCNNSVFSIAMDTTDNGSEDTFPTFGSISGTGWHFLEFERVGNNIYCYYNGVQSGSAFNCTGDDIGGGSTITRAVMIGGTKFGAGWAGTPAGAGTVDTYIDAVEVIIGANKHGGTAPGSAPTEAPVAGTEQFTIGDPVYPMNVDATDVRLDNNIGLNWADTQGDLYEHVVFDAGTSGVVSDPNLDDVVFLLSAENAGAGATTIIPEIGGQLSKVSSGTAEVSTDFAKFGSRSLKTVYPSGANFGIFREDSTNNTNWDFGTGDFTVEFHYYRSVISGTQYPCGRYHSNGVSTGSSRSWYVSEFNGSQLYLFAAYSHTGAWQQIGGVSSPNLQLGQWYHVAFTRSGSNVYTHIDGVYQNTNTAVSTNSISTGSTDTRFSIWNASGISTWYVDNIRVTKGYARYNTSSFTPPAGPYDGSAGARSEALVLGDPAFETIIDGSATTVTGTLDVNGAATYDSTLAVAGSTSLRNGAVLFDPGTSLFADYRLGAIPLFTWNVDGTFSIFDVTGADSVAFSHDGTDFNTALTNTTDWNITGAGRYVWDDDLLTTGGGFLTTGAVDAQGAIGLSGFMDAQATYVRMGAYNWTTSLFDDLRITSENIDLYTGTAGTTQALTATSTLITNRLATDIANGVAFRILDSTNSDAATFSHDGVDFNTAFATTSTWDIQMDNLTAGVNFSSGGAAKFYIDTISSLVELRDGWTFRIRNAGDTDYVDMSHDGVDFNTAFTNTTDWNITGLGNYVNFYDGVSLRVYDNADTNYILIDHDGTDARLTNLGGDIHVLASNGAFELRTGTSLWIWDSTDIDYAFFSHDGTDFNTTFSGTTDWNITGASVYQFDSTVDALDFWAGQNYYLVGGADSGVFAGYNIDSNAGVVSHLLTGAIAGARYDNQGVTRFYNDTSQVASTVATPSMTIGNDSTVTGAGIVRAEGGIEARTGSWNLAFDATNADYIYTSHSGTHGYVRTAGTGGGSIFLQPASGSVGVIAGFPLRIYDPTNVDYASFQHDGTDFNTDFNNTTDWNINNGTPVKVWDSSGIDFIMLDPGTIIGVGYPAIYMHQTAPGGTNYTLIGDLVGNTLLNAPDNDIYFRTANVTRAQMSPAEFDFFVPARIRTGNSLQIFDSTNADSLTFSHDGTDFNTSFINTTQWNVTGVEAIKQDGSIMLQELASAPADATGYGQVWVESSTPQRLKFTNEDGNDLSIPLMNYAHKDADTARNTTITLADDDDIVSIPLRTAAFYSVEMVLIVDCASATPDFDFKLNFSNAIQDSHVAVITVDDGGTSGHQAGVADNEFTVNLDGTNTMAVRVTGYFLTNATTGGTVALQWAQNVSDATNVTLSRGSWCRVTLLGA